MKLPTTQDERFVFSDLFNLDTISSLKEDMRSLSFERQLEKSPYIPKLNPNHVFEYSDGFRKTFFYLATGKGLAPWLFGPQGCGKTSGICQLGAWFNVPVRQIYASETMESEDMLFGYMPGSDGVLRIRHYALALAMKNGWWFIVNEFDLLAPSQQKALNQIIEERVAELPTGERIIAHKNFRLIVTANTNGSGDFTGNNCNVGQSDSSVSARFFFVPCDYLSPEQEEAMLLPVAYETLNAYGISVDKTDPEVWQHLESTIKNLMIPNIVSYANTIRDSYNMAINGGKGFPFTLGQRTTIEWISESVVDFLWETDPTLGIHNAIEKGLEHAFLKGVRPDYQKEAKDVFNDVVGNSLKVTA